LYLNVIDTYIVIEPKNIYSMKKIKKLTLKRMTIASINNGRNIRGGGELTVVPFPSVRCNSLDQCTVDGCDDPDAPNTLTECGTSGEGFCAGGSATNSQLQC